MYGKPTVDAICMSSAAGFYPELLDIAGNAGIDRMVFL